MDTQPQSSYMDNMLKLPSIATFLTDPTTVKSDDDSDTESTIDIELESLLEQIDVVDPPDSENTTLREYEEILSEIQRSSALFTSDAIPASIPAPRNCTDVSSAPFTYLPLDSHAQGQQYIWNDVSPTSTCLNNSSTATSSMLEVTPPGTPPPPILSPAPGHSDSTIRKLLSVSPNSVLGPTISLSLIHI